MKKIISIITGLLITAGLYAGNRSGWNTINPADQTLYQVIAGTYVFTDSLNVYPLSRTYTPKIILDGINGGITANALSLSGMDIISRLNVVGIDTATLRTDLTTEKNQRISGDNQIGVDTGTLRIDLTTETSSRIARDNSIGISTGILRNDLTAEINLRQTGDYALGLSTYALGISTGIMKNQIYESQISTGILQGQFDTLQNWATSYYSVNSGTAVFSQNADMLDGKHLSEITGDFALLSGTQTFNGENIFRSNNTIFQDYTGMRLFKTGDENIMYGLTMFGEINLDGYNITAVNKIELSTISFSDGTIIKSTVSFDYNSQIYSLQKSTGYLQNQIDTLPTKSTSYYSLTAREVETNKILKIIYSTKTVSLASTIFAELGINTFRSSITVQEAGIYSYELYFNYFSASGNDQSIEYRLERSTDINFSTYIIVGISSVYINLAANETADYKKFCEHFDGSHIGKIYYYRIEWRCDTAGRTIYNENNYTPNTHLRRLKIILDKVSQEEQK